MPLSAPNSVEILAINECLMEYFDIFEFVSVSARCDLSNIFLFFFFAAGSFLINLSFHL